MKKNKLELICLKCLLASCICMFALSIIVSIILVVKTIYA